MCSCYHSREIIIDFRRTFYHYLSCVFFFFEGGNQFILHFCETITVTHDSSADAQQHWFKALSWTVSELAKFSFIVAKILALNLIHQKVIFNLIDLHYKKCLPLATSWQVKNYVGLQKKVLTISLTVILCKFLYYFAQTHIKYLIYVNFFWFYFFFVVSRSYFLFTFRVRLLFKHLNLLNFSSSA